MRKIAIFALIACCMSTCKCSKGAPEGANEPNPPSTVVDSVPLPPMFSDSLPCPHDPLIHVELARPSDESKEVGALWGCRRFEQLTCSMPKGNRSKKHGGLDIKAPIGTNVFSMFTGKVVSGTRSGMSNTDCDSDRTHGNRVIIRCTVGEDNYDFYYCHLTDVLVSIGETVVEKQIIGTSGTSGNACRTPNPHLHVEVKQGLTTFDPEVFMYTKFDDQGNKTKSCR